jgi:hypothetical protein
MEKRKFETLSIKTRAVRYAAGWQVIAFFLGLILLVNSTWTGLLFISILSIFLILGLCLYIYKSYQNNPNIQEKKQVASHLENYHRELSQIETYILGLSAEKERIEKDEKQQITHYRNNHQTLILDLEELRRSQEADHRLELQTTLSNLQDRYLRAGLRSNKIEDVDFPGIGADLEALLIDHGIITAEDLIRDRIDSVPGFGDVKVSTLLDWKNSLELELKSNQPQELTKELKKKIDQKYQLNYDRIQQELELADESLDEKLTSIQSNTLEIQLQNINAENSSFSKRDSLTKIIQETRELVDTFSELTLRLYVTQIFSPKGDLSILRRFPLLFGLPIVLILGFLIQSFFV